MVVGRAELSHYFYNGKWQHYTTTPSNATLRRWPATRRCVDGWQFVAATMADNTTAHCDGQQRCNSQRWPAAL